MEHWRWLAASALAASGIALARMAAQPWVRTPIDGDLPLIALLVVAWAWSARAWRWSGAIETAVPLLAVALLLFPENDRMRLAVIGAIVAAAFLAAAFHAGEGLAERGVLLAGGLIVLRWLPLDGVELWRELMVLAGTAILFYALGGFGTEERSRPLLPLLLTAALGAGLVTPIHPGRPMLFPFALALLVFLVRSIPLSLALSAAAFVAACFARSAKGPMLVAGGLVMLVWSGSLIARRISDRANRNGSVVLPHALLAAWSALLFPLLALWPWSGVIARALPLIPRYEMPGERQVVGAALPPSESTTVSLPPHTRCVVVTASGANASRLREGRLVGTIESADVAGCRQTIRIGDIADFGFDRSAQFFSSRNSLPRRSEWDLRDYGMQAWVHGAGRVTLRCGQDLAAVRITAASALPPDARLQIESIESAPR